MSYYCKYDLVMIVSAFRTRFEEEFYYGSGKKSILEDIFYVQEKPIEVKGKVQEGYTIMFYFKNGVSITPKKFCILNNIQPVYTPFVTASSKLGK